MLSGVLKEKQREGREKLIGQSKHIQSGTKNEDLLHAQGGSFRFCYGTVSELMRYKYMTQILKEWG